MEDVKKKPPPPAIPRHIREFEGEAGFAALDNARREAIRERDYWLDVKKSARDNRDLGRFAKDEERMWLGRYRAACLVLGYCYDPGGDAPFRPIYGGVDHTGQWPAELQDGVNWVETRACAAMWGAA